jgi:hypothetical protein
MADERPERVDREGNPINIKPSPTTTRMRLPGEDINDYLPDWFTRLPWWQEQHAKGVARDEQNLGTPREKRMNLFEWIKSVIMNPNISSTQASQMLNDAGVMAKDMMMAMNPMGTAHAFGTKAIPGEYQDTPTRPYDPTPTPIVNPQHTGPEIADPGGEIAAGPHLDVTRPTIPDTGNFTPPVREPTTAMYGSNVRASQMTPGLEQERIRGEFYNMPSTPPVPRAGMGFEDVKRRSSVSAPKTQSTGLIGRTPYQGPGKRGFTPGRATTAPRRFGPH